MKIITNNAEEVEQRCSVGIERSEGSPGHRESLMKLRFRNVAFVASIEPHVLLIRQRLPLTLVGLGVLLTVVWVILVCWLPFQLVAAGLQATLGDVLPAALAAKR